MRIHASRGLGSFQCEALGPRGRCYWYVLGHSPHNGPGITNEPHTFDGIIFKFIGLEDLFFRRNVDGDVGWDMSSGCHQLAVSSKWFSPLACCLLCTMKPMPPNPTWTAQKPFRVAFKFKVIGILWASIMDISDIYLYTLAAPKRLLTGYCLGCLLG